MIREANLVPIPPVLIIQSPLKNRMMKSLIRNQNQSPNPNPSRNRNPKKAVWGSSQFPDGCISG
jgi:hypothetical protein